MAMIYPNSGRGIKRRRDTDDESSLQDHSADAIASQPLTLPQSLSVESTATAWHQNGQAPFSPLSPTSRYTLQNPPATIPRSGSDLDDSALDPAPKLTSPTAASTQKRQPPPSTANFRNVSACDRCRTKKIRCDQALPACSKCQKAGVKCVGFDTLKQRPVPRDYLMFLEERMDYLESKLKTNSIPFSSVDHFVLGELDEVGTGSDPGSKLTEDRDAAGDAERNVGSDSGTGTTDQGQQPELKKPSEISQATFSQILSVMTRGYPSRRNSDTPHPGQAAPPPKTTLIRDSIFGLQTKPNTEPAPFPDKDLALKLVNLYFEYPNPQIPIIHRVEFMELFNRVYADPNAHKSAKELYFLNIVFAIGSGTILDVPNDSVTAQSGDEAQWGQQRSENASRSGSFQRQPEEYHAAAIVHLDDALLESSTRDEGALEKLQAILLLASFALLRPVTPGLWHIVGMAMRLAISLGLHHEDGNDSEATYRGADGSRIPPAPLGSVDVEPSSEGRYEWIRDLKRRLFWCTYSLDRLVSACINKPVAIADEIISTNFPTPWPDESVTRYGMIAPLSATTPSYKLVAIHYFRLRLLQSEISQVHQYEQAQWAHATRRQINAFMPTQLPSPFLHKFNSFREWRRDVRRRLWDWNKSAPSREAIGVEFNPSFLELNYWQTIIMLYRPSMKTPAELTEELKLMNDSLNYPPCVHLESKEDEESIYQIIAEAGQRIVSLYHRLHNKRVVNYTYLATHHLFIAGLSFLCAIWDCPSVRNRMTVEIVERTISRAVWFLEDLISKCPPAQQYLSILVRVCRATIQYRMPAENNITASSTSGGTIEARTSDQAFTQTSYGQQTMTNLPSRHGPTAHSTRAEEQPQQQQQQQPVVDDHSNHRGFTHEMAQQHGQQDPSIQQLYHGQEQLYQDAGWRADMYRSPPLHPRMDTLETNSNVSSGDGYPLNYHYFSPQSQFDDTAIYEDLTLPQGPLDLGNINDVDVNSTDWYGAMNDQFWGVQQLPQPDFQHWS